MQPLSRRFLDRERSHGCCVVRPKASEFWLERVTLFRADLNYNRLANSLPLSLSFPPGCTPEIQQTVVGMLAIPLERVPAQLLINLGKFWFGRAKNRVFRLKLARC